MAGTETARRQIEDSIAFLTVMWAEDNVSPLDDVMTRALGVIDYKGMATGVSGIAHYFASRLASLEGEGRTGEDILRDMGAQVAAQLA